MPEGPPSLGPGPSGCDSMRQTRSHSWRGCIYRAVLLSRKGALPLHFDSMESFFSGCIGVTGLSGEPLLQRRFEIEDVFMKRLRGSRTGRFELSGLDLAGKIVDRLDLGIRIAEDISGMLHLLLRLPHEQAFLLAQPLRIRQLLFCVPTPMGPVTGWFFEVVLLFDGFARCDLYFDIMHERDSDDLLRLSRESVVLFSTVDAESHLTTRSEALITPPNAAEVVRIAKKNAAAIQKYNFREAKTTFLRKHSLYDLAGWTL